MMYSIMLRNGSSYTFYQAEEGINFAGTLAEAKAEYIKLLKQGTAANKMIVVHNTTVSLDGVTITDVEE